MYFVRAAAVRIKRKRMQSGMHLVPACLQFSSLPLHGHYSASLCFNTRVTSKEECLSRRPHAYEYDTNMTGTNPEKHCLTVTSYCLQASCQHYNVLFFWETQHIVCICWYVGPQLRCRHLSRVHKIITKSCEVINRKTIKQIMFSLFHVVEPPKLWNITLWSTCSQLWDKGNLSKRYLSLYAQKKVV